MIDVPRSWEFVLAVESAGSHEDISALLVKIAETYGFRSVFGGLVPDRLSLSLRTDMTPYVMVQHLPAEWAERYNQHRYLLHDPIMHRLRTDLNPFAWRDAYASCTVEADTRLVGGGAAEFGLRDGYVVPVNTLDHRVAAVSFGGAQVELSPDDAAALSFCATFAVGHFLKLRAPGSHSEGSLTSREAECLLWAAEGKTDWEISVILGISRSTVIKHIAHARQKLGAVNRAHATAIAVRKRLFTSL